MSLEDGGRASVRVRDDGTGMSAEDLRLSIERHATSKIASFEDLLQVSTLGFRGEALPSIGSVSKMTITTRLEDSAEGTRLVLEGGLLRGFEPAGCPRGTTVEVTDLFYNVPARRKFLRARQTETSKILEICQRMALSHPELQLSVTSDGRLARRYLPARSLAERARQIFGQVALREIHSEREGLILDAELARPGARHLFLLVNGRPILDRSLARAVAFAYGDRLAPGCYPRGVVSLRIPGEAVDVNAHPQKTEVRFRRAAELLDQVTRMISSRLAAARSADAYWESRIGGGRPTPDTGPRPPLRKPKLATSRGNPMGFASLRRWVIARSSWRTDGKCSSWIEPEPMRSSDTTVYAELQIPTPSRGRACSFRIGSSSHRTADGRSIGMPRRCIRWASTGPNSAKART